MTEVDKPEVIERLDRAYETMLKRVSDIMDTAELKAAPIVREAIEQARDKAVELGELSREEAERIGAYLERDLREAGEYLADTGKDVGTWLRADLERIGNDLLDLFAGAADQVSRLLREAAQEARKASLYHTGEITGPGALLCTACGKELHFHRPGHIPPCPSCHATSFRRARADDTVNEGVDQGEVDGD